jgi:two-component system response regulator AtoC
MVVDDDPAMREMVVCMLDCAGFDAEAAADGDEALFAVQARPYDLALCDVHMPRRDGFDFARAAHEIRPGMPVVLMSAFGCRATRNDAAAAGAAGFIAKPFSILQLRTAVGAALSAPN